MEEDFRTPAQKWVGWLRGDGEVSYWWTRFFLLRGIGVVYLVAFLIVDFQWIPLLGESGVVPAARHLAVADGFWSMPSLLWLSQADWFARLLGWFGTGLAAYVVVGRANAIVMAALWVLYSSFANVSRVFWGYGWEMLLMEAGFLAIFLPPLVAARPRSPDHPPSAVVVWLYRWLTFRVMFGAGLIKLRGDPCWRELTCLMHHYETQPLPNPVSWYLHQMPGWFHRGGVLFNHFVELVVPFLLFAPRRVRHVGGGLTVAFQATLIVSGNLSFLNLLTIVVCLGCFDDSLLCRFVPASWRPPASMAPEGGVGATRRVAAVGLALGVAVLSVNPVANLVSPGQAMNRSYTPFNLVNTYGAFGGVTETRYELEIQGTSDSELDEETTWRAYRFPCKPGPVGRAPCQIFPYHYRLDWQMWFAAMRRRAKRPWLFSLVYRLLRGHEGVEGLLARVPFEEPPSYIRIVRYRYAFTGDWETDAWWRRERVGTFLRPVSLESSDFVEYLRRLELVEETGGGREAG